MEIYRPDAVLDKVLPDLSASAVDVGEDITLRKGIRALINRFFREVVQTTTTQTVKNDSGVVISTMSVSESVGVSQTKGAST